MSVFVTHQGWTVHRQDGFALDSMQSVQPDTQWSLQCKDELQKDGSGGCVQLEDSVFVVGPMDRNMFKPACKSCLFRLLDLHTIMS
eukprot:6472763-Amphidinium_carterae.1